MLTGVTSPGSGNETGDRADRRRRPRLRARAHPGRPGRHRDAARSASATTAPAASSSAAPRRISPATDDPREDARRSRRTCSRSAAERPRGRRRPGLRPGHARPVRRRSTTSPPGLPQPARQVHGRDRARCSSHALLQDRQRLPPAREAGPLQHLPVVAERRVAACVVEVDPETGYVEVLRYCLVHDAGTIINPLLAEANLHGGITQGIGGAMYEQIALRRGGPAADGDVHGLHDPDRGRDADLRARPPGDAVAVHAAGDEGRRRVGRRSARSARSAARSRTRCRSSTCSSTELPLTPERVWAAIRSGRARPGAAV